MFRTARNGVDLGLSEGAWVSGALPIAVPVNALSLRAEQPLRPMRRRAARRLRLFAQEPRLEHVVLVGRLVGNHHGIPNDELTLPRSFFDADFLVAFDAKV